MIKAVILDVDGVIVGNKTGINFPLPHTAVINLFKKVRTNGIPIVLCTAKFNFAIKDIIYDANLNNPHITDGGALIYDPLNKKIISKHLLEKSVIKEIVREGINNNLFLELYTEHGYFIQKDANKTILQKRVPILQKDPIFKDSLEEIIDTEEIIKMIFLLYNDEEKIKTDNVLSHFKNKIHYIWSRHPALTPITPCVITAPGVSKKHATIETFKNLNISLENVLGLGDSLADWHFMDICKYVAAPENAEEELKNLVLGKGKEYSLISPSVDENGIINIFEHFGIV